MKKCISKIMIMAGCLCMLAGCGKGETDKKDGKTTAEATITTEEVTEEPIVGAPDNYGWLAQASYTELAMQLPGGESQMVYSTLLDDRLRLAYDNPSYIFFADVVFQGAVIDINAMYETEHFEDLDGDGYGDFVFADCIEGKYVYYCYIYNPDAVTFDFSQSYSDLVTVGGSSSDVEIPENLEALVGSWYLDGKLANDYVAFYPDGTMMECTSEGVAKYQGKVTIADREYPDGTIGKWVEVYSTEDVLMYGFEYPDGKDYISFDSDEGGKIFYKQALSE